MFLESKSKFDWHRPQTTAGVSGGFRATVQQDNFASWSSSNMYRTSYNDMSNKTPVQNKNHVIPGYQGYVPSKGPDNELGGTFTTLSRRCLIDYIKQNYIRIFIQICFTRERVDKRPHFNGTASFNFTQVPPKQDDTLRATTHKYGKQTIPVPHPNQDTPGGSRAWSTSSREFFGTIFYFQQHQDSE